MACFGQSAPVISSVSVNSTYPVDSIIITGSGFSSTAADMQVWFGQVAGTVITSGSSTIKVVVPPQARYSNIEVTNLATRLSTKSAAKFQPYYSGSTFNAASMVSAVSLSNINQLYDVCTCDFNLDGKPDMASTKFSANDIQIFRNTSTVGAISFTQSSAAVGFKTQEVACGDLNGDGKPDIVASKSDGGLGGNRNTIYILTNTSTIGGAISFDVNVTSRFLTSGNARFINIRDLDLDGKPEIVVASQSNTLYIFQNQSASGTLNINATPLAISVTGSTSLYGLEIQDMDGDSKPDLIMSQFQTSKMFILRNQSTLGNFVFGNLQEFGFSGAFNELIAADFNEDGKIDFANTDWGTSRVAVWINTTTGNSISFSTPISLSASTDPDGIDVGDIDGDQDLDIIVASRITNNINVFLNSGNNTTVAFSAAQNVAHTKTSRNVLLSDLDGDGKPEIVATSRVSNAQFSLDVFRNQNCFVPAFITTSPKAICPLQPLELQSIPNAGVTYDWKRAGLSIGATSASTVINTTGTYTLLATSESGTCNTSALGNITVSSTSGTVPPDPVITAPTICSGQTLSLSTSNVASASYIWTGPNGFTTTTAIPSASIPAATIAAAGEYTLQIKLGNCESNVKNKLVNVVDLGAFAISSASSTNSTCQGTPLSLQTRSDAAFNYQWILGTSDISGQTISTFSASQSGDYKVRVTNPSIVGCTIETQPVSVKVLQIPDAKFTVTGSPCVGTSIAFNSSTSVLDANGTAVFAWNFGDSGTDALANPNHTFATANTFNVSFTASYLGVAGCSDVEPKAVLIHAGVVPVITATLTEICPNEETELEVTGGTFSSITWSNNSPANPTVVSEGGTYSVNTLDANGCPGTDSQVITEKPGVTVEIEDIQTTIRSAQEVQLQASGAEIYSWTPDTYLDNPNVANPKATPLSSITYRVVGTFADPTKCGGDAEIAFTIVGGVIIPNVFTPNGDSKNDTWVLPDAASLTDCLLTIFDKTGAKVLEQGANEAPWDGTMNGKPVPPGTYYYIIACPQGSPTTGHVLVAR